MNKVSNTLYCTVYIFHLYFLELDNSIAQVRHQLEAPVDTIGKTAIYNGENYLVLNKSNQILYKSPLNATYREVLLSSKNKSKLRYLLIPYKFLFEVIYPLRL